MKAFHIIYPALIALMGMSSEPMFFAPLIAAENRPESTGTGADQNSGPKKDGSRQTGRPVLRITPIGDQNRKRIAFRIEIRNEGKEPIGWDREFAVLMDWELSTDAIDEIKPASVKTLPVPADAKSRFIKIAPGQSVSKEVELTMPHRRVVCVIGVFPNLRDGGPGIVPFGHEKLTTFVIPENAKSVGVEAVYTGIPADEAVVGVLKAVGVHPSAAGLPQRRIRSGQVRIPLEPGAPPPRGRPVPDEDSNPATKPLQPDDRP